MSIAYKNRKKAIRKLRKVEPIFKPGNKEKPKTREEINRLLVKHGLNY